MQIKTSVYKIIIVSLLLSIPALAKPAGLVAHYTFDDGTAKDVSGNKHDGKLVGQAKIVKDAVRGKVLEISSKSNSWVDCGGGGENGWATFEKTVTVNAWVKTNKFQADRQYIVSKGNNYTIGRYGVSDHLRFFTAGFGEDSNEEEGIHDIQDGKWHMVTFVRDGISGRRGVYVDAQVDSWHSLIKKLKTDNCSLTIGGKQDAPDKCWVGFIDDVRIYDRALSLREIEEMCKNGKVFLPEPQDGTGNNENNVKLSWKKQNSSAYQQLYFGTSYYAVVNNEQTVYKGPISGTSFDPEVLKSGTTYYWKVNVSIDDDTIEGYVWSFRTKTEGFYMDLFKDGGLKLTTTSEMPAADMLALSNEHISAKGSGSAFKKESEIQNNLLVGNDLDENGVLLYPDGAPRFRCIYVAGGLSTAHGKSLAEKGRDRIRQFFFNGGSYSGSCAGAFLTSLGVDSNQATAEAYLHIWPAKTIKASGIYKVGYEIPENSPILRYFDFGNDYYIENVQHWNGPYVISDQPPFWCENTEVLARFSQVPQGKKNVCQGNVSLWAYKKDSYSGMVIPIASHPEDIADGEQRDMMASILLYDLDGQGKPKVKAVLENNVARQMNDNNNQGHEKIGDKQYHHFIALIPVGTKKLTIDLNGVSKDDLNLYAKRSGFAFSDCSNVIAAKNNSSADESIVIKDPQPGEWYIGVKGVNTVKTTRQYWGYEYTANTHLLNGLAYSIKAKWDIPKTGKEKTKTKK